MDENDLIVVVETDSDVNADICRQLLEEAGIAVVVSEGCVTEYGGIRSAPTRLSVLRKDVQQAGWLIQAFQQQLPAQQE